MKNKIISIMFCIILGGGLIINIITPHREISYAERRTLAQRPDFSKELIFEKDFGGIIENYALDQFAFRDEFRSLKALWDFNVLRKLDNNNIYVNNGFIFSQEFVTDEKSVENMAHKIDTLYEMYLKDCNVVLAVIPDKNEFAAEQSGHLALGYDKTVSLLLSNLKTPVTFSYNIPDRRDSLSSGIHYLDLGKLLTLNDYYKTDLHWRQEKLSNIVSAIGDLFDFSTAYDNSIPAHATKSHTPFYGAYYGQAALNLPADTLTYINDKFTDNARITDYDQSKKDPAVSVYNTEKLGTIDSYDVFFSGNSPLITIENPLYRDTSSFNYANNTTKPNSSTESAHATGSKQAEKELIIFRDSFGSSLAPLLLEGYSKITLVDLRFISASHVGDFVDFTNQDVLILYGQTILNNSSMIRM